MINKLPEQFELSKYGAAVRLVHLDDAEFIVRLRTDDKKSKFLNEISTDINVQKKWIEEYKLREKQGNEYYFIVCDANKTPYGTTRLYNFAGDRFETGSWVFLDHAPEGLSIIGDILGREIGFDVLGFKVCTFEVRKGNAKVIKYHRTYGPDLRGEDDVNYYYELSREKFTVQKEKLLRIYDYGIK